MLTCFNAEVRSYFPKYVRQTFKDHEINYEADKCFNEEGFSGDCKNLEMQSLMLKRMQQMRVQMQMASQ